MADRQDQTLNISSLQSGGLITNYYCTSACRHCLYRCGPKWPKDYINSDQAANNFAAIKKLHCSAIHIGGGEPFLKPDFLVRTLEIAKDSGVRVEYVETNSSWYKDQDSACSLLADLAGFGLSTLLVSISPFHNEYIPYSKVKGVMEACRKTGIAIFPWTADFMNDLAVFDDSKRHRLTEYCEQFGEKYIDTLPGRYWIAPGGRALETFNNTYARQSIDILLQRNGCCHELGDTSHFHLDLFGNYIPGLCSGLSIKREDLGKPLLPKEYPIISSLYTGGIVDLLQYAEVEYGFKLQKADYWSKCELCYEIRKFIVVEKKLSSKELQPEGHYLYG